MPKMEHKNSSKAGSKDINDELLEKLKAISYWERKTLIDVLNNALSCAVKKYENKNGKIISMHNTIC